MSDLHALPERREIGRFVSETPGPTLIAIAGCHGNEKAGVPAIRRVLATLERRQGSVRGEILGIAGNLGAMQLGVRFRHRDMNRVWTPARVDELEARAKAHGDLDEEDIEQLDILETIRAAILRARGPVFIIDLHTTSAHGLPFVLFSDTLRQRKFAGALPLPIMIGLQEQVDGVLVGYWTAQGCTTFSVEGGQHDDPGSVDNLEAALLLGAESAGVFGPGLLVETEAAFSLLERRRGSLPRVMEVVSRHAITPEDRFVMEPGFANLAKVRAGTLLARDRGGDIVARKDGFVLLPLYQGLGAEGFFWGREMSSARLRMSEMLRSMKLERFLHLLPGVKRDPKSGSNRLTIAAPAAKLYPLDVFHTLGYRRVRRENDTLLVERQSEH